MFTTIECTSRMAATPIFIRMFWLDCDVKAHALNDKKRKYKVSVRYKTNDILLPKIYIGQLETKTLIWKTVNPKAAKEFLYSLHQWAHIAPLPSTKVFQQLATKLLYITWCLSSTSLVSMAPLTNFISFVLFSWSQKKANRVTISRLQSFLLRWLSSPHRNTWRKIHSLSKNDCSMQT